MPGGGLAQRLLHGGQEPGRLQGGAQPEGPAQHLRIVRVLRRGAARRLRGGGVQEPRRRALGHAAEELAERHGRRRVGPGLEARDRRAHGDAERLGEVRLHLPPGVRLPGGGGRCR